MAPRLPALTCDRARSLFALATVCGLAFVGAATVIEVTNPGDEEEGGSVRYLKRGDDYFVAIDIFWAGDRMAGHWHAPPFFTGSPDRVVFVAGSDVVRLLNGQEPEHLYGTYPAWSPGGWVGDLHFVVPDFTCSGPTGRCEYGDLPAVVFMRGNDWRGAPLSLLQGGPDHEQMPQVSLHRAEAWVLPTLLVLSALATLCFVSSVVAGVTWWASARRGPKPRPLPMHGDAPLEMSLRLVDLSRLYLGSVQRSLYLGGAVVLVGGIALQLWGVPAIEELLSAHLPFGSSVGEEWLQAVHWLAIPYGLVVAAVFWVRQLRQLRAEQRRWSAVAGRIAGIEQQVLG